jgi:hypothetical protein
MSVFQNVFAKKDIVANGEEIRLWHKVGVIKSTKSGGKFLQMFHQPETDFYVFDDEKEEEALPVVD